jgi:hypothetical protein
MLRPTEVAPNQSPKPTLGSLMTLSDKFSGSVAWLER